ncbi:MAG: hypothetical protein ACI379_08325 [Nocardioides sp.]|uniref:hypothetical protein n=1 Tax=Nocardioides sp. TaxID=35761 RepID=UPI003F0B9637
MKWTSPESGSETRRLPSYEEMPARRPWRVVNPVGSRWMGNLDGDPIRMWTTQTKDAYAILAGTGSLRGDPSLVEEDFVGAYAWMQGEADRRLTTCGPGMLWL